MSIEKVTELIQKAQIKKAAFHENVVLENIEKLMPYADNWEQDLAYANENNKHWPKIISHPIREFNQPSALDCNYLLYRFNQVIRDRGLHAVRSDIETLSCAFAIKKLKTEQSK